MVIKQHVSNSDNATKMKHASNGEYLRNSDNTTYEAILVIKCFNILSVSGVKYSKYASNGTCQ